MVAPIPEVPLLGKTLHDRSRDCTGGPEFAALSLEFKEHSVSARLGTVIPTRRMIRVASVSAESSALTRRSLP